MDSSPSTVEDDLAAMFAAKKKKKKKKKKKTASASDLIGSTTPAAVAAASSTAAAAPPAPLVNPYANGGASLLTMFAQPITFEELLAGESAAALLADPNVRAELIDLLPEEQQTDEELSSTLSTAQLKAAARLFTRATKSSHAAELFMMLGLDRADGAAALEEGDHVRALLDAIETQALLRRAERDY